MRLHTLSAGAAALAMVLAGVPARAESSSPVSGLDVLRTWNLVVLGNLTSSSEVEGKTFVGGDLDGNSSNYQIEGSVSAATNSEPGLTVVGNVDGGAKNLDNGSGAVVGGNVTSGLNLNGAAQTVQVGGTIANTNVDNNTVTSGLSASNPAFAQALQQQAGAIDTSMTGLSQSLGKLAATSTLTVSGSTGTFNAQPDAGGVAVFNISSADLGKISQIQFNANGADTVIVNVSGSAITLGQNFLGGTDNLGEHVIWNFPDARTLSLSTAWGGSVLAPEAAATTSNYIQGSAVFGSLVQNGEMHVGTYDGVYDGPTDGTTTPSGGTASVPEPGLVGMLALALGALAYARRRRTIAA